MQVARTIVDDDEPLHRLPQERAPSREPMTGMRRWGAPKPEPEPELLDDGCAMTGWVGSHA
jgi:hypothetical protein